jgi:hypothetical protein
VASAIVEQGNRDAGSDLRGDLVHRVGADHKEIGSGALQPFGGVREEFAAPFPLALCLAGLNFLKVDARKQAFRRVQPPSFSFTTSFTIR